MTGILFLSQRTEHVRLTACAGASQAAVREEARLYIRFRFARSYAPKWGIFMKLKKCNAILGLAIIAAVLFHAGTMTYSLLTSWYSLAVCKALAHTAVSLLFVHILISLCIFFFSHDGSSLRYPRMNSRAVIQRVTALLMIVLVHLQIGAYSHMATGETLTRSQAVVTCLTECLYLISVFLHISVSFSKAFITLGLAGSSKTARRLDIAAYTVCTAAGLAALFAVIRFFLGGLA